MRTVRGIVTSTKMDKTAVVKTETRKRHEKYLKTFKVSAKHHVDDPNNELIEGQTVVIGETRPLSKTKRWKVIEIIK